MSVYERERVRVGRGDANGNAICVRYGKSGVACRLVSMVPLGVGLRCTRTDLRSRRRVASPSGLSGVVCVVRTLIVYLRSSVARLTVKLKGWAHGAGGLASGAPREPALASLAQSRAVYTVRWQY